MLITVNPPLIISSCTHAQGTRGVLITSKKEPKFSSGIKKNKTFIILMAIASSRAGLGHRRAASLYPDSIFAHAMDKHMFLSQLITGQKLSMSLICTKLLGRTIQETREQTQNRVPWPRIKQQRNSCHMNLMDFSGLMLSVIQIHSLRNFGDSPVLKQLLQVVSNHQISFTDRTEELLDLVNAAPRKGLEQHTSCLSFLDLLILFPK